MLTRRSFLGWGATGVSAISLKGMVPDLFAQAAVRSAAIGTNDHVLVVLELAGGNDGLNTVVPFGSREYYVSRPNLGIAEPSVLRLSSQIGLHPKMSALADLFKDGRVAIVQGVGYPEPDRSHFRSMEIWHTASTNKRPPTTGWLGRFVDTTVKAKGEESFCGMCLTATLPQALHAEKGVVPVTAQLDALAAPSPAADLLARGGSRAGRADATLEFLREQAAAVYRTAARLKEATDKYKSTVEYPPSDLGSQLRRAAQIIAGGLGTRVLFASQGGYDTHAYQADGHGALLEDLSNSLAAFFRDLKALRLDNRVIVMAFSEFGRRVEENASAGTDHGAASCMFVVGSPVKGGLAGKYPTLRSLDEGDLAFTTDFRSVYATMLEGWLGCPAARLLGAGFPQLDVLA